MTPPRTSWYEDHMYSTRIYYQDTDAGGVVYFANYMKFIEKSWFEHLLSIGISLPEWEESGTYIMVKNVSLDLVDKVRYGDTIRVVTSVKDVKLSSFLLAHEITKEEKVTTRAETQMVCVNQQGKLTRMPAPFKQKLLQPTP